jgi:broad specificity phosphatase PhoE
MGRGVSAHLARRRIFLMRHGHVDYFSDKVLRAGDHTIATLTPQGQEQARAAGAALAQTPFDIAIASGYLRTNETAELVLAAQGAPPPLWAEPALVELKGGTLKFASRADAATAMKAEFARAGEPGARMFNGESFAEAQIRAVGAITALLDRPAGKPPWSWPMKGSIGWCCHGLAGQGLLLRRRLSRTRPASMCSISTPKVTARSSRR